MIRYEDPAVARATRPPVVLVPVPEDRAVTLQVGQEELGLAVTAQQVPQAGEAGILHLPHTLLGRGSLCGDTAHTHTRTYTHAHARTHGHTHTHTRARTRTRTRTHTQKETHRQTDRHTHTQKDRHAHTYTQSGVSFGLKDVICI